MPIIHTCQRCGKVFESTPSRRQSNSVFCSRACYRPNPRVTKTCERCGIAFDVIASRSKRFNVRFCSKACQMNIPPAIERFEASFRRTETCWLWTKGLNSNGYGSFHKDSAHPNMGAHRFAYETYIGPIPDGLLVCHTCDVRNCVNPSHLYAGTEADNSRDMESRGRGNHPKGMRMAAAKLTDDDVREIRRAYAAGGISQQALADQYGVAQHAVSRIVRGLSWKHVK